MPVCSMRPGSLAAGAQSTPAFTQLCAGRCCHGAADVYTVHIEYATQHRHVWEPWCCWLVFMQAGMLERMFGVMCASATAARQAATGVCECSSACKGKVAEQALVVSLWCVMYAPAVQSR